MNSRFIATISPTDSVEEARAFMQTVRLEFPDASHHVPAFVIGGGNTLTEYCSDDGEPSGTSGRPLLAVLKGSDLGNVAVVVSRYFGGSLLGTGGLVKAYSEAGRTVTGAVGRATLVPAFRASILLPYPLYERSRQALEGAGAIILREDFAEAVAIEAEIPETDWETFSDKLASLGAGSIPLRILAKGMVRRPL
ncbi:MAG: YigZ family protein [Spirochaetota bacterium]